MYQPSQVGAGTICASEMAITISATSIWNPALQYMQQLISSTTVFCYASATVYSFQEDSISASMKQSYDIFSLCSWVLSRLRRGVPLHCVYSTPW